MLDANTTWFNFEFIDNIGSFSPLSVYAFSGTEEINRPFEFRIELVSKSSNLNLTNILGKKALLTVYDKSGDKRLVHGVIRQMEQLHTANAYTHYVCELVPRFWFLKHTQDHHIYQHKTVPDIIRDILARQGFAAEAYEFNLGRKYPEREYCVQYGESDFHFINRVCEEEGIHYYFRHTEDEHCLIFSDALSGPTISGENPLRFFPGSGNRPDTAVVSRLALRHRVNSNESTYREWNFTHPPLDLTSNRKETSPQKAPAPEALHLETYQFPHLYQTQNAGTRYAELQLLRQLSFRQWIECEADVSRFMPGFSFTLYEHPRADANRGWWIVSVQQQGEQPQVLEHEAPDRGMTYSSTVQAIPDDTWFVPELRHKKVRIEGLQSAIVTGPANEEVYTDKYGRVKVQFHWDRLGEHNECTTCWVRVADTWAGNHFGFIQLPRIGQEVMVEFMEGDPDRPVITGRVYNELNLPPWNLPEQTALSGIQSREFHAEQRNQLVFDDTKGQVQAQLSSDHGLSQLNLGYLTRVDHVQGRKDFRGEGFELRTDAWGAIRAGRGLLISTDRRHKAEKYHKDLHEAQEVLGRGIDQHKRQAEKATHHKAQSEEPRGYLPSLEAQLQAVMGPGSKPQEELAAAQMVLSSPDGIALTSPKTAHVAVGNNFAITTGKHFSAVTGESFEVSAYQRASIYAHTDGINLFAGHGPVQIQAQSDVLDIIAEKVVRLISAKENIHISAPKEIILTAGDSYIKINSSGIESGTKGAFTAHASDHSFTGPKTLPFLQVPLPASSPCLCEAAKNGYPLVEA